MLFEICCRIFVNSLRNFLLIHMEHVLWSVNDYIYGDFLKIVRKKIFDKGIQIKIK